MAKAKKRVAARKRSSKRGKASAKPARKKAAKHATSKKAKSKVRRTTPKSAAKKKRSPKTAARAPRQQVVEVPVEDTIIDVIEEPVPERLSLRNANRLGLVLPFRPTVSPSAASVPRRNNNKSRSYF